MDEEVRAMADDAVPADDEPANEMLVDRSDGTHDGARAGGAGAGAGAGAGGGNGWRWAGREARKEGRPSA